MDLAHLGVVGNCQIAAHVSTRGEIVWACLPRFDSAPVFGSLLDPKGGGFEIGPIGDQVGTQRYLRNTNVLETTFDGPDGAFRVLDLAPRFMQHGRSFRPTMLLRIVEPLRGTPQVRVRCEPVLGWSMRRPEREYGSHHVAYAGYASSLRLTTDAPLAYLGGEASALTRTRRYVLTWGAPIEEPLEPLCDRFLRETTRYWETWVKHLDIPSMYQDEVIRSALALKLHCYEDTGAIVAALTTAIPEAPGSGRTWDYRYCWLRDAFYTLRAFRMLGNFEEREQFLHYLLTIAAADAELNLAPLYTIDGRACPAEQILPHWAGFAGDGPVRVGNEAASHRQHDVFGEMVLALAPMFLDARFRDHASPMLTDLVVRLADRAIAVAGTPDAGIWEFRANWRPQAFSTLMCWAAADRASQIARRQGHPAEPRLTHAANALRERLLAEAIDSERGCLTASHGSRDLDASLLQAVTLHLLPASDPRLHATIDAIRADLDLGGWVRRYRTADDFGVPEVAFTLCTYWLVEALARVGRLDEARALMRVTAQIDAPLGLLAEDVAPATGRMSGNFPQAYSHVGQILAAFAAAPRWADVE